MAFSQVNRAVHMIILAKGKADRIIRVNICDLRDIYTVPETFLPKDHPSMHICYQRQHKAAQIKS